MFWISSGKDLALWMNLLRWPILSAIAVNPEPGSRWNCTWSIYSLSTACDTLRRRPSQKGNKKPDFLFPSAGAYHDTEFPVENLRMLAVKTTCKDRWRQILNEADKIHQVHLFTLQEGVSLAQYREMRESGVRLVVPSSLHKKYPEAVRAELMTLGAFIAELTGLYADIP